jgi:hypothetical protein
LDCWLLEIELNDVKGKATVVVVVVVVDAICFHLKLIATIEEVVVVVVVAVVAVLVVAVNWAVVPSLPNLCY